MRSTAGIRRSVRSVLLEAEQVKIVNSPLAGWTVSREDCDELLGLIASNAGSNTKLKSAAEKLRGNVSKEADPEIARKIDAVFRAFISGNMPPDGLTFGSEKFKDTASIASSSSISKDTKGMISVVKAVVDAASKTPKASPIPGREPVAAGAEISLDPREQVQAAAAAAASLGATSAAAAASAEVGAIASRATRIKNKFTSDISPLGPSTDSIKTLVNSIVETWLNPAKNTSGDGLNDSQKSVITLIRVTSLLMDKRNDKETLATVVGAGVPFLSLLAGPAVTKFLSTKYMSGYVRRRGSEISASAEFLAAKESRRSDIFSKELPELKKMIDDIKNSINEPAFKAKADELEKAVTTLEQMLQQQPSTPGPGGLRGPSGGKQTSDARRAIADNLTKLRTELGDLAAKQKVDPDDLQSAKEMIAVLQKRQKKALDEYFALSDLLADPKYAAGIEAVNNGIIGRIPRLIGQGSASLTGAGILLWSSFTAGFDNYLSRLPPATATALNLMGSPEVEISEGSAGSGYEPPGDSSELYQEISGPLDTGSLISAIQEIQPGLSEEIAANAADALSEFILNCLTSPSSGGDLDSAIGLIYLIKNPNLSK